LNKKLNLIKKGLVYFTKATVGLLLLWIPSFALTMGMFGGAYLLDYLVNTIANTPMLPSSLDLYSLIFGVFTGCGLSVIWIIFIFGKIKICFNDDHKEKKEPNV